MCLFLGKLEGGGGREGQVRREGPIGREGGRKGGREGGLAYRLTTAGFLDRESMKPNQE